MRLHQLRQPAVESVATFTPNVWAAFVGLLAICVWACMVLLPYMALPTTAVASVKTVCAQSKGCVSATPTMFGSESRLHVPRMGFIVVFNGTSAEQGVMLKAIASVVDTSAITIKVQAGSTSSKGPRGSEI